VPLPLVPLVLLPLPVRNADPGIVVYPPDIRLALVMQCAYTTLARREENVTMRFQDVLRNLRQSTGLTQEQLADKSGVAVSSLRCHEQGQRMPSWVSVVKLAKALDVSCDAFADCDEVRTAPAPPKRSRKAKGKVK